MSWSSTRRTSRSVSYRSAARSSSSWRTRRSASRNPAPSCTAQPCTVPAPSVVRLKRFVRVPYRGPVPLTRRALFARDGGRCMYCGGVATSVDHVIPRSRGGSARLGQRGGVLPPLQPRQGRPSPASRSAGGCAINRPRRRGSPGASSGPGTGTRAGCHTCSRTARRTPWPGSTAFPPDDPGLRLALCGLGPRRGAAASLCGPVRSGRSPRGSRRAGGPSCHPGGPGGCGAATRSAAPPDAPNGAAAAGRWRRRGGRPRRRPRAPAAAPAAGWPPRRTARSVRDVHRRAAEAREQHRRGQRQRGLQEQRPAEHLAAARRPRPARRGPGAGWRATRRCPRRARTG